MSSQVEPQVLFSSQEIAATIEKLSAEIKKDYRNKNPLLIGILKGSFIFMADLVRLLDFSVELDFVKLSSYGQGRSTAGELKMLQGLRSPCQGQACAGRRGHS